MTSEERIGTDAGPSGRSEKFFRILVTIIDDCEKELQHRAPKYLAGFFVVSLLRSYLEGTQFTIQAHHDTLRRVLNLSDETEKLAQWPIQLLELEFNVAYCTANARQKMHFIA